MAMQTQSDATGLGQLDVRAHPSRDAAHFRRILAAREAVADAEQELREAVEAARSAGVESRIVV